MGNSYQIIKVLDEEEFAPAQFAAIRIALSRAEERCEAAELDRMANHSPEELLPDWGCYDHPDEPSAVAALNKAGVALVRAIREEKDVEEPMRQVRIIQEEWARAGADDTEGREALWQLVRNACAGTVYDPERLWDRHYS